MLVSRKPLTTVTFSTLTSAWRPPPTRFPGPCPSPSPERLEPSHDWPGSPSGICYVPAAGSTPRHGHRRVVEVRSTQAAVPVVLGSLLRSPPGPWLLLHSPWYNLLLSGPTRY